MNKEQLTQEISKKLKEIRDLYYKEYPQGDYLILYFRKGFVSINNEYWEYGNDETFPINYNDGYEIAEDDLEEILEGVE